MIKKYTLIIISIILIGFSTINCNSQSQSTKLTNHQMKWNFKNFEKLTFSYKQTISSNTALLFDSDDRPKSITEISGVLVVEVTNKNVANITLKDVEVSNFELEASGNKLKVANQKMPNMILIEGVQENGEVKGEYNPEFVFFSKTFFPIINKQISLGNSYTLPINVPFGVAGTTIDLKGDNSITYVSNKNEIAKLETVIDVADFNEPKNLVDTHECSLKGQSTFSFNYKKGVFTSGQIDLKMSMGKKGSDVLEMDMDVKIILELKNIE